MTHAWNYKIYYLPALRLKTTPARVWCPRPVWTLSAISINFMEGLSVARPRWRSLSVHTLRLPSNQIYGRKLMYLIRNFFGNIKVLKWAMSEIYSLSWESWMGYVAIIEGNFPQCDPQYIAVFGGTIPLLVRIMWALPMHYPGHFPHCTQEIIMDFFYRKSIINCLPIPLLFA